MFEKIQGISCIFQIRIGYKAQILKICKIHKKSRIRQMTVLFCKYLAKESSDLYEMLCGGQLLSFELKFSISWWSLRKCMHTSRKHTFVLFNPWFSYEFCIFSKFEPQIPSKFEKYMKFLRLFQNTILKRYDLIGKNTPPPAHSSYSSLIMKLKPCRIPLQS